jgi:hypothetical protein
VKGIENVDVVAELGRVHRQVSLAVIINDDLMDLSKFAMHRFGIPRGVTALNSQSV